MTTDTPDRILRLKSVLQRTGLSRSTMYRKMQNGTFPKNIQISTRCTGWRESAVAEWLKNPMFYQRSEGETANQSIREIPKCKAAYGLAS